MNLLPIIDSLPITLVLIGMLGGIACVVPRWRNFLAPFDQNKPTPRYQRTGQFLISLLVISLAFAYEPEVYAGSSSLRCYLVQGTALILLCLFFYFKWSTSSAHTLLKIQLIPSILNLSILLTVVAAVVASFTGISAPDHWWQLKNFLSYTLLFIFTIHFGHQRWYHNLLWLIAIGASFNAMLGILQFFAITGMQLAEWIPGANTIHFLEFFEQAAPPAASFSNKNLAASYLLLTLPIIIYLCLTCQSKRWSFLLGMSTLTIVSICLVYTRTRASWISALAVLIFAGIWLALHSDLRTKLKSFLTPKVFLSFALSLIIIGYASTFKGNLKGHSLGTSVTEQFGSIGSMFENKLEGRGSFYISSLAMLKNHPQGVGLGGFESLFPKYQNSYRTSNKKNSRSLHSRPRRMHNDMLQAYVELGIIGGTTHLLIFLSPLWMAWRLARNQNFDPASQILAFFLLLAIGGLSVNSLADFPLQMPVAASLIWILLGMLVALYQQSSPQNRTSYVRQIPLAQTWVYGLLCITSCLAFVCISYENTVRRTSSIYLQQAYARSKIELYDEQTLALIQKSYQHYSFNNRVRETYATIASYCYFNPDKIEGNLSFEECERALDAALRYLPYAENLLINASVLQLAAAQALDGDASPKQVETRVMLAHYYAQRALAVSHREPKTLTIYAASLIAMHQTAAAIPYLDKALTLQPDYEPAQAYRKLSLKENYKPDVH